MTTETLEPSAHAAARPAYRTPLTIWLFVAGAWLLGWWFLYDGLHQRLWGDYTRIDGQLGPWAGLAQAVGLDPQRLALFFIALGSGLLGASFGVLLRRPWGYYTALLLSAITLLYLGFGTPVALACLLLLVLPASRRHALL